MSGAKDSGRVDFEDLAAAAMGGVARALAARKIGSENGIYFPIWVGFMMDPRWSPTAPWELPVPGVPQPGLPAPLTARDHTVVVEAVIKHVAPLRRVLGAARDIRTVSPEQLLTALLRVGVDAQATDAIQRVMAWRRWVGAQEGAKIGPETSRRIAELMTRVRGEGSFDGRLRVLKEFESTLDNTEQAFAMAVRIAMEILVDGRRTIYAPEFYSEWFGGSDEGQAIAKDAADEISSADIEGTIAAGVLGGLLVVVTPAVTLLVWAGTALAGGIASSSGKAAGLIWDSLWE